MDDARAAWAVKSSCIALAVVLNWAMQGYHFGHSNHTVYLLDALRHAHPQLLQNDWFTTQTFQYHALFGVLTRALMRLNIVEPAFLVGYLTLLIAMHASWWRIVRAMGGDAAQFLVSQVIFQLLGAGVGLGMYMILQDSCFLPSNVAAVAMLWAIALWLDERPAAAGIALGVAGAFHLNFAPVAMLLWVFFVARSRPRGGQLWLGSACALLPAAINILFALKTTAGRTGGMPLGEFVEIYVRLRHPHHYDPSSWPAWLWLAFLLPVAPAIAWWYRRRQHAIARRLGGIFVLFVLILVTALIGAGMFYVSESLIQASLYRFSIYPKLLACMATAFVICDAACPRIVQRSMAGGAIGVAAILVMLCVLRGPYVGMYGVTVHHRSYDAACAWIRANTPADAVFLVTPNDEGFRVMAQRAVVVNFKAVPQLSGELVEWRRRMETVLDLSDIRMLPRPHGKTVLAIRDRFDALGPQTLTEIARQYGARYIFNDHRFDAAWEPLRVEMNGNDHWFLYDLQHGSEGH